MTVRSSSDSLDEAFKTGVIKRFNPRRWILIRRVRCSPPRFNLGRHNSVLRARVFDDLRWSSRPRDRKRVMLPRLAKSDRYNLPLIDTCVDPDRWSASASDRHVISTRTVDPTPLIAPRSLHLKTLLWDFSPTGKKLVESVGFIWPDGLKGRIPSRYTGGWENLLL